MTTSRALASYSDVREALDRALEAENGVRVRLNSKGKATNLVQRIYSFRQADRKKSLEIYPRGHPMHDASVYDCLSAKVVDGDVFIQRPQPLDLEEL